MNGGKPSKDSDEKSFNETLKRMLKTPPAPKATAKPVDKSKPPKNAKRPDSS